METITQTDFMIGCNYWGSKHGTEMWRSFDADSIDRDFQALSKNGCDTLRIFPLWRDFQPVISTNEFPPKPSEYRMDDGSPDGAPLPNIYGLDPVMVEEMATVCQLAQKHGLSLIISMITGQMSGRYYTAPVLAGKNPIADPEALRWEYRFAKGLVHYLKEQKAIRAWELGNECSLMGHADNRHEAYVWTATIVSAIRSEDTLRPIFSGNHMLSTETNKTWTIADQAELTDMMTPHPYPADRSFGSDVLPVNAYRSLMLPTAKLVLYASIAGKPAMIEEQGTFNNIYANREIAGFTAQVNLESCWAHGGQGHLWWCAHEQKNLEFAPYCLSMRELGWLDENLEPKPVARATKAFGERLKAVDAACITERRIDAVCVLTQDQDHWQVGSMSFLLGKQASMEIGYVHHESPLPQATVYLLPSVTGWTTMYKRTYHEILRRVREDGAVLYLSWDGGALELFEEVFALRSLGMYRGKGTESFHLLQSGETLSYECQAGGLYLETNGAEVLAENGEGYPVFTRTKYGKGQVFFLSFGLEQMLWHIPDAFEDDGCAYAKLYRMLLEASNARTVIRSANPMIGVTRGLINGAEHAAVINYSTRPQDTKLTVDGDITTAAVIGRLEETLAGGDFMLLRLDR